MNSPLKHAYLLTIIAMLGLGSSLRAQTTQEVFGKNRVQFKKFEWKQITTTNFEIFFYQDGNQAAYMAARYAEADFDRIADLLGYTPYSKTKIFLYNSFSDLQQSNVGLAAENSAIVGGQATFVRSQVEIPFTGNQVEFKRELSRSISQVFISEMMFGGSLKDVLQSSLFLTLPDWFITGAAAYVAGGWSIEMDDYARDAILSKNVKKPATLTGEKATFIGQSIWNFIAERYGKGNISNILNLTRIIRNEETSISSTLGIPYSKFLKDWKQYYSDMAAETAGSYVVPKENYRARKTNRRGFLYNQVAISPDSRFIAYSENNKGILQVKLLSTEKNKRRVIFKGGSRVINQPTNPLLPLVSWQNNRTLAIITVEKGQNKLYLYEVDKRARRKARRSLGQFDQILDFDISDDGTTMALSADKDGQSDIYLVNISRNATTQLTNDLFDDLHPHFLAGSNTSLLFSSNRQSDSLNVGKKDFQAIEEHFDIYLLGGGNSLQRLITSGGNITHPISADSRTVFYIGDVKGIRNIYRFDTEKKTANQVTNFRQNIRSYDINLTNKTLAYRTIHDGREYVAFIKPFDLNQTVDPIFTKRNSLQESTTNPSSTNDPGSLGEAPQRIGRNENAKENKADLEPGEINTDDYQFDQDVTKADDKASPSLRNRNNLLLSSPKAAKKENLTIRGPFKYQSRFSTSNVNSTLLINPITGWGINFDVNMNDMLEDHFIKLGGLLNTDLRSNNFYGEYRYLKSRVDFTARVDRKQMFINTEAGPQKYRLNQLMLAASYPFSVSSRVTVAPFFTNTRYIDLSLFAAGPIPTDLTTNYGGLRLEYVFDNTIVNGLNMVEGTRMKVRFDNYTGINQPDKSFYSFNVDLRNYKKIHRDIILATRLAYGHFGGPDRKRYLLGGMDNWLFNSRETERFLETGTGLDRRDLYFTEFVTNLRGFAYNKVAGYNYGLFNAELRLPLIKYFYRGPITSNFLRNLQFVAFTDIGTAWNQQSPFNRQNDLNTVTLPDNLDNASGNPFRATVVNFKNPFLIGYGIGVRTFILGYYVKFDNAWGVENYVRGPARFYLTLGYDF